MQEHSFWKEGLCVKIVTSGWKQKGASVPIATLVNCWSFDVNFESAGVSGRKVCFWMQQMESAEKARKFADCMHCMHRFHWKIDKVADKVNKKNLFNDTRSSITNFYYKSQLVFNNYVKYYVYRRFNHGFIILAYLSMYTYFRNSIRYNITSMTIRRVITKLHKIIWFILCKIAARRERKVARGRNKDIFDAILKYNRKREVEVISIKRDLRKRW